MREEALEGGCGAGEEGVVRFCYCYDAACLDFGDEDAEILEEFCAGVVVVFVAEEGEGYVAGSGEAVLDDLWEMD